MCFLGSNITPQDLPLDQLREAEEEIQTEKRMFEATQREGVACAVEPHKFSDFRTESPDRYGYISRSYLQGTADRLTKVPDEWKRNPD